MRVAIATTYDLNLYPAQYYLACELAARGAEVTILSEIQPKLPRPNHLLPTQELRWSPLGSAGLIRKGVPLLRGQYANVYWQLRELQPDWVIAQHGLVLSGALYKLLNGQLRHTRLVGYFGDYIERAWWLPILKGTSAYLDAYIDVCDLRLKWRTEEWPRLTPTRFVIRNAPPIVKDPPTYRDGNCPPRVVFTGVDHGAGLRVDLLLELLENLCDQGIEVVWYLPATADHRAALSKQLSHPRLSIRAPISKTELAAELRSFDAGLLWTPTTEAQNTSSRTNYVSAASNKLGEYLAAGLAVIHTDNPGLHFLRSAAAGLPINPWEIQSAVAASVELLKNTVRLREMRQQAFAFHKRVLNAEQQSRDFADFVCSKGPPRPTEGSHTRGVFG